MFWTGLKVTNECCRFQTVSKRQISKAAQGVKEGTYTVKTHLPEIAKEKEYGFRWKRRTYNKKGSDIYNRYFICFFGNCIM